MPDYITGDDSAGNVQTYLAADFLAVNPGVILRMPAVSFAFMWNNVLINFTAGQPAAVPPDLFAAMVAAGQLIS